MPVLLFTYTVGTRSAYTYSAMSITVRLWNGPELQKALSFQDPQLATVLMNATTFDASMMAAYNYLWATGHVKAYRAAWDGESVTFNAPNDEMALWFLSKEYTRAPDELTEIITTYREVPLA